MKDIYPASPEWRVSRWLNSKVPLSLGALRGKVVMVSAFQMLCPGCVSESLPQALRVREAFSEAELAVVGLHTVFEHHDAMTPISLAAFLHEYRITIPVGVDEANPCDPIPMTMQAYAMRGTPTTLLFDRSGRLRRNVFGHIPDLRLAADIMALVGETNLSGGSATTNESAVCTPEDCGVQDYVTQAALPFYCSKSRTTACFPCERSAEGLSAR
jgi:hypothetical protein